MAGPQKCSGENQTNCTGGAGPGVKLPTLYKMYIWGILLLGLELFLNKSSLKAVELPTGLHFTFFPNYCNYLAVMHGITCQHSKTTLAQLGDAQSSHIDTCC